MSPWFAALLLAGVAACASVPLSTVLRMSRFEPREFAAIDPAAVRVRVALPEGFVLDVAGTKLEAQVVSGARTFRDRFDLVPESATPGSMPGGLLRSERRTIAYVAAIAGESKAKFRALQAFVGTEEPGDIHLDVNIALDSGPRDAKSVTVWVDLLLAPREGFFPLVEAGELPIGPATVYGKPAAPPAR